MTTREPVTGSGEHMIEVQGYCMACGRDSLFVGEGGYLTCSQDECPDPAATSNALTYRRRWIQGIPDHERAAMDFAREMFGGGK